MAREFPQRCGNLASCYTLVTYLLTTVMKSTMTETCSAVLRSRRNCSSDGEERTDDGRALFHTTGPLHSRGRSTNDCYCYCSIPIGVSLMINGEFLWTESQFRPVRWAAAGQTLIVLSCRVYRRSQSVVGRCVRFYCSLE